MRFFSYAVMALMVVFLTACDAPEPPYKVSGGKTSTTVQDHNAFSMPAANLSITRRDQFFIGNAFFTNPWVSSPASTTARDGLGPVFNTNSCQSCHVKDGRGKPPTADGERFVSALIRLSVLNEDGSVSPEPTYGGQFNEKGVSGVKGEGLASLEWVVAETGNFADGKAYELIQPMLHFDELNYGPMQDNVMTSVRAAPVMIGLGLLDAIKEEDLIALADPDDKNGDGISGRINSVWDRQKNKQVAGRFGWKSNEPNVHVQSAGAFNGDIGITSSLFPDQSCTKNQSDCLHAPNGGNPEIEDKIMDKVAFYARHLAVPVRRNETNPQVLKGERLFNQAGCAGCHVTTFVTGELDGFPELSHQIIHPLTDLLIHDMGEGLADHRPDHQATGSEWRTAPLWGIGLVERVNGHTRFLHDGRARNLMEAVLWHGGEAETAKQAVVQFNQIERDALIAYLNSL